MDKIIDKITNVTIFLNLYILKKEINDTCKDITLNDYIQLKQSKKVYDCLECTNQQYKVNGDLLNDVNKYNTNKKCMNKYELMLFYDKLFNKN